MDLIKTILINALPASGKSETRAYLDTLDADECTKQFHLGETVQLDDYPYVHFMRRVDEECTNNKLDTLFFRNLDSGFANPYDWGTLMKLLNEDYDNLLALKIPEVKEGEIALWLFNRYDKARELLGQELLFKKLPEDAREALAHSLEKDAAILLKGLKDGLPKTLEGKTVVIECARGGKDTGKFPLAAPFGYAYSYSQLSDAILADACVLYVWVTPEQSRQKNRERAKPGADGSILFHGVPEDVMLNDYGCDDIEYLVGISDKPNTIKVEANGNTYHLPTGMFDNRGDLTSFARAPVEEWDTEDKAKLRAGLEDAFDKLYDAYKAVGKKRKTK